jgi:hypothetical protein
VKCWDPGTRTLQVGEYTLTVAAFVAVRFFDPGTRVTVSGYVLPDRRPVATRVARYSP